MVAPTFHGRKEIGQARMCSFRNFADGERINHVLAHRHQLVKGFVAVDLVLEQQGSGLLISMEIEPSRKALQIKFLSEFTGPLQKNRTISLSLDLC